jgi:hypothetical protein
LSKPITFDFDRQAEDLRVFLTAWRPAGTDVKVYARFHHSSDFESVDDKLWTPLTNTNPTLFSSSADNKDVKEYQFSLPLFPESIERINNSFTTTNGSAIITATGNIAPNTQVVVGQPVKLYSPLFPGNYMVSVVAAASATTITLTEPVSFAGVTGVGMSIDILRYKSTAFNDKSNGNVLRYLNSTGTPFNKFNYAQLKIVLLTSNTAVIPFVDQIEAIGVSA